MAPVTIRVHQPVLGWPSGTTVTVELTPLIQGLIDNQIAEVIGDLPVEPEPVTAPEPDSDSGQTDDAAHEQPDPEQPDPGDDSAKPRRRTSTRK